MAVLSLLIWSCGDNHKITIKDEGGRLIEEFYVGNDSLKHGEYKAYYESGKLKEISEYNHGSLTGVRTLYYPDGGIEILEQYDKLGKLDGVYKQFYENGTILAEKEYKKNVLEGQLRTYYPNGKIKEEVSMVQNEENGPFKEFFENGQLHWKGNYRNGDHEYGLLYEYDSRGQVLKIMKCDTLAICTTIWKPGMPEINPDTVKYD